MIEMRVFCCCCCCWWWWWWWIDLGLLRLLLNFPKVTYWQWLCCTIYLKHTNHWCAKQISWYKKYGNIIDKYCSSLYATWLFFAFFFLQVWNCTNAFYLNCDSLLFQQQYLSRFDFLRAVVAALWLGLSQLKRNRGRKNLFKTITKP